MWTRRLSPARRPHCLLLFFGLAFGAFATDSRAQTVRAGSFTKATGGAPVAQVVPHGLGQTPSAVILWTDGKTNASFSTDFLHAFGMTDGTTSKSVAAASRSNNAVPIAARRLANKALTIVNWTPTVLAEADLQSWNATSFTLNWTTNNATPYVVHFIAIGGSGVSAKVVGWTMPTSPGNQSVSGIGFTPDVVLHAHLGDGFLTAPPSNNGFSAHFGLGAMDDAGGQWATDFESVNAVPADTQRGQQAGTCIYGFNNAGVVQKQASFVSMDADGFTVNFTAANSNASQVISLALKGVAAKAGSFLKSTTLPPAASYVQSQTFSTAANVTFASVLLPATTAGNLIVVSFDFHQPAVVSSVVDDKGNTYQKAIGPTNWGPSPDRMYTYYARNITGGATTVTVNLSGGDSNGWIEVFASEYRGIDPTDPLDQTSEATGSGGNPMASGTLTTTSPDEILYSYCGADTGTITLTAPFTTRRNPNGNPIGDASVTSIGTYNLSSSIDDTGAWSCQMLSFRHAGVKQSVSSLGFSPDAVLLTSFQDVPQAGPVTQSRLGLGAMDGAFHQGASAVADRDAVNPTSVQGVDNSSRAFIKVNNSTSTIDAEAVLYGMDTDGFTLDWTTNDAVGTEIHYLALGTPKASSYSRFRTITVPTASLGASCTASLTNFPLLVSLSNDLELRTVADGGYVQNANGYDIVFTDASNNPLDHEIELYTSAPGGANLVAWVRVPTLSVLGPTLIGMQYGNASVTSPTANPAGVWDSNYKAVWHLTETGTGAAGEYQDATSYGNHGQGGAGAGASVPARVAAKIGFGQSFDGTDDFIDAGNDASVNITGPITLEAWVQLKILNPAGTGAPIVAKGSNPQYNLYQDWDLNDRITFTVTTPAQDYAQTPGSLSLNTWYHAVGTYDGAKSTLYINGALIHTVAVGSPITAEPARHAFMGKRDSSASFFNGPEDEVRISSTARSKCWIETEYNNENNPSGFVTLGAATSTAVELMSFDATGGDGEVDLSWETGSETHNLGFHLYRSLSVAGPFLRITAAPIAGLGSSPEGARYAYRDPDLVNGTTYFYELEDVETTGRTKLHGPVSATPMAASSAAPPGPSSGPTDGDPVEASLEVKSQTAQEMVLELRTESFTLERQEDGSVRISIPGFTDVSAPGAPAIPVKRSWVSTPAGRGVRVVSVRVEDVETSSSLRPAAEGSPELVASRTGLVRAGRRGEHEGEAFRRAGMYPESLARVVSEGYQGDEKKTLLELAPVRWNRTTGELSLARRLTVRLLFTGREQVTHRDGPARRSRTVARRLVTREPGLYGVSYEEVFGRSRRGVACDSLRLSRLGDPVAFHLEPDGGVFGPGSTLYFLSVGAAVNPYGEEAVYELESGSSGERMTTANVPVSGAPVSYYWREVSREENRYYQAALLEAKDPWLWDVLLAPVSRSYSFEVSARASSLGETSRLSVWLQGASDLPESPDHHVRVRVNGVPVSDAAFDGMRPFLVTAEIPSGALQEGENELAIENVGDTEAAYSMVMLDRFEVSYPRSISAEGGVLEGRISQSGVADVRGVSPEAVVLDTTDDVPVWLGRSSRFSVKAGRRYLVVSPSAVGKARVELAAGTTLESPRQGADYLVIAPSTLLPAVEPLLELRRSQGLRARGVALEDVDSAFGSGESRPEALKDFLSYAYHQWQKPSPRYVLLVGDATYDFKDYLGTGVKNQVPPFLVKTSYLWTASDLEYATVHGDDDLPDFSIGRLPAASPEEARVMVEKILAYEASGSLSGQPVVLVADNPDLGGDFERDAERIASSLSSARRIYLSRLGTETTRAAILDAFDRGARLMSYVGHGGISLWAQEDIFDTSDVAALAPQSRQPLVLTFDCLNGYFHFPYFDSLAERLVKAEGRGAIAAFSPSGLSLDGPAQIFHEALVHELLSGKNRRLGDAVLAAQSSYAESGAFPELLRIYHLFGDPALVIR